MVLLTVEPHQSLRLHTLCSTTGSKACCSLSGIGPWAETEDRAAHINTSWQKAAWNNLFETTSYILLLTLLSPALSPQHFTHSNLHLPEPKTCINLVHETKPCFDLQQSVQRRDDRRGHGDITVQVAPAGDVTRCPVGGDLSSLRKTSHANAAIHNGALIQFQQGKIISVRGNVRH